ncbi:MAG: PKD domain-containing protein [Chloroflexi bacterium]|nr:PKD domain-containing protein [Chloroflexota bacterium]
MRYLTFLHFGTRLKPACRSALHLICGLALLLGNFHPGMAAPTETVPIARPAAAMPAPPVVDFSGEPSVGQAPLTVQFHDLSTGDATTWAWDFGDHSGSTQPNPVHVYTVPGAYTVTLQATNGVGSNTTRKKNYIIVNSAPSPFTALDRRAEAQEAALERSLGYVPAAPTPAALPQAAAASEPNPPTLQTPANGSANIASPATTLSACVSDPDGGALAVTFYGRDISPITVPDFTLVALPDTQNYYSSNGLSAPSFLAQVQWILANRVSRNIPFVTQLGDLVNDGSIPGINHAVEQWMTADGIMRNLETGIEALLDGVPYGIAPGNHDEGTGSKPNPEQTELYNKYFGISRFAGRSYYGGHYGTDNDNHYELFSAGDLNFVIVHLEYDTSSRPAVYAWADSVLKAYPDRWGIVTMHELIGTNGAWHPQGTYAWNGVRNNPNLWLMFAGHVPGEGRRQDVGYHGNVVNTLMSDYQSRPNGGDGWFRYMEFSAASSEVLVNTYSVTRNEYELDADSFFKVAFDAPSSGPLRRPFQIINRQTNVPSGSCPTTTWNGLVVNHQYEWYVGVSDSPTSASDVQTFSSNRSIFSTGSVATPAVKFSSATYSASEASGTATITVTLNQASSSTITVNYATSNDAATAGSDYTAINGTLTFAAGEVSKTLAVPILEDSLDENNETINLTLSGASNAVLDAPAVAVLTITDNDNPPTVQFSSGNYSGTENGGTVTITATLSTPSGLPVTVNYASSNGSALAGSDYTAVSGVLTFNPGQISKTFALPILQDTVDESNETISLALTNPGNATLGAPVTALLTVVDDDGSPTIQFNSPTYTVNENAGLVTITATLSVASSTSVTVNYASSNGSALAGSDYTAVAGTLTFAPNQTSKTFTLPILQDTVDESNETINLALTNPGNATLGTPATALLTVVDDDNPPTVQFNSPTYRVAENGGTATITVTLNSASSLPITVTYATSNGDATAGSDYQAANGLLTFNPGQTSQIFTLGILDDNLDESDETITLALGNPSNASLGAPSTAILTLVDNDPAVIPLVQFSAATYSTTEEAVATITAVLNAATTETVTVNYASSDGTASAGSDYTTANGTLIFAPGQTSQTFMVPILTDDLDELDETIHLSLSAPSQATLGDVATATLTIVDDDAAGELPGDTLHTVQFSTANLSVNENGGAAIITAKLGAASGVTITVNYASQNGTATAGSDYRAVNGTLIFKPGQTSQTFSVAILEDSLVEGNETIGLSLSNPTHATLGVPGQATVTIIDNDLLPPTTEPTIQFSAPAYQVDEQVGMATVTVMLSAVADKTVSVNYATSNGAATDSDYAPTSGGLAFQPGQISQSFTIPILDDALDENDETVNVLLSNANNATLGLTPSATLTIVDNDSPPTVEFGAAIYQVDEESPSALIEVKLSRASGLTVTVNYHLNQATATGATAALLVFTPGETSKTLEIPLIPTGSTGPATNVAVTLDQPQNASLGAINTTTLTVVATNSVRIFLPSVLRGP